ncbi:MAG: AMP-binding protein, partial [Opitutaceae bacterium]|nr:AMP-binding protein [Opitutaceae bacterium]
MTVFSTIHELLAAKPAAAVAFAASGCPPLTYGGLRDHVERTVASLNRLGIGRNDRVALVLPNGTEMATAFVAVAAGTTSAPLNPAYRADELEFYLSDLKAKALIVERGSSSPALGVAANLKIPVIEIVRAGSDPAGVFELVPVEGGKTAAAPAAGGFAGPDDIALVLHTSGTTSRPKIVPLSQRNVCASAGHIRDILSLTPADRG